MTTPERVASVLTLFAPLIVGFVLFVTGLVLSEMAYIALGGGALGIRGFATAVGGGTDASV